MKLKNILHSFKRKTRTEEILFFNEQGEIITRHYKTTKPQKKQYTRPNNSSHNRTVPHKKRIQATLSTKLYITILSTIMTTMAITIAYLLNQLASLFTAFLYRIPAKLTYYKLQFNIPDSSNLWTPENIIVISLTGPLLCLTAAFIVNKILKTHKITHPLFHLFGVWLSIYLTNRFYGALLAGIITKQGLGFAANWMFLPQIFQIAIAIIFLGLMFKTGVKMAPVWTILTPYLSKNQTLSKKQLLKYLLLYPTIISSACVWLTQSPHHNPHETILLFTPFCYISGLYSSKKLYVINKNTTTTLQPLFWIIGLLTLLIIFRMLLN